MPVLFVIGFAVTCQKPTIAHSFAGQRLALPAEMQGEIQGMASHWSVEGQGGAVSSANALATEAGIDILKRGGNAVDAALAVQWVLAVVEPQSSGLGGGGFLLYYDAQSKKAYALDGREEAPEHIDERIFLNSRGEPLPFMQRVDGARAVGVPGTVALMAYAKKRFGSNRISFAATFERAIQLARDGIRVSPRLSEAMRFNRERFLRQNGGYNPYLHAGREYFVGEVLYQSDLASTLEKIATQGAAEFYTGAIGEDLVRTVAINRAYASRMAMSDLAKYRVVERRAAERTLATNRLFSVSAPASGDFTLGAIVLAPPRQPLELLVAHLQALLRQMRFRETLLEDPDFAWSKPNVMPKKFSDGQPANAHEAENTTHVSIIDAAGNAVSLTSSIEMSMGSALMVRGRGFVLNNQLSDFSAKAGLINSVEAGRRERQSALNSEAKETMGAKRPKSSMSPMVIVTSTGRVVALGSPGGPTIVGTNALVASRVLAGEELQEAVLQPRALVMPDMKTLAELPIRRNAQTLAALRARGFAVDMKRRILSLGSVQAVEYDARTKKFIATTDLRREGLGLVVTPSVE